MKTNSEGSGKATDLFSQKLNECGLEMEILSRDLDTPEKIYKDNSGKSNLYEWERKQDFENLLDYKIIIRLKNKIKFQEVFGTPKIEVQLPEYFLSMLVARADTEEGLVFYCDRSTWELEQEVKYFLRTPQGKEFSKTDKKLSMLMRFDLPKAQRYLNDKVTQGLMEIKTAVPTNRSKMEIYNEIEDSFWQTVALYEQKTN